MCFPTALKRSIYMILQPVFRMQRHRHQGCGQKYIRPHHHDPKANRRLGILPLFWSQSQRKFRSGHANKSAQTQANNRLMASGWAWRSDMGRFRKTRGARARLCLVCIRISIRISIRIRRGTSCYGRNSAGWRGIDRAGMGDIQFKRYGADRGRVIRGELRT